MSIRPIAVAALLTTVPLVGCGAPPEGPGVETSPTASPSPSASASPSPSPSPSPVTPTDGTDLSACSDGECEVEVSPPAEFEIESELGPATLTVDSTTGEQVHFLLATPSGLAAESTIAPGGGFAYNDVAIEVPYVADGSAVVRMARE